MQYEQERRYLKNIFGKDSTPVNLIDKIGESKDKYIAVCDIKVIQIAREL